MPDLLETYALQTGLTINKPEPFEQFFPLPADEYILFVTGSGMPGKNYDYFNEVINLIRPHFNEEVKFVQIGMKDDPALLNVIHLQGMTTIPQMMFLIKHAKMVVANDTSAIHIASVYDVPLVALYGSTHPKIHGPHFGTREKQRLLESHRNGKKPSYNGGESPKTVNMIKPEQVAQAVLDLFQIPKQIGVETVHIGDKFHSLTLELVCDQILAPTDFQGVVLTARMDYLFNENYLFHNLAHRKLAIVTDRPINVEVLTQLRQNVAFIAYLIEHEDYNVEFVKQLRSNGLPYKIVSSLQGAALAKAKLAFFDLGNIVPRVKITKDDLENRDKITINTMYRSNRFILSGGQIFLNRLDWKNGKACPSQRENKGTVIDDPLFWEDSDYFYLYNYNG